jgi:hypothetical protein
MMMMMIIMMTGEHEFLDGYLFYRFIAGGDDEDWLDRSTSTSTSTSIDMSSFPDNDLKQSAATLAAADPNLRLSWTECRRKIGLLSIGEILRHDVKLYYKYSVDKECFTANEAIDYMITAGLAGNQTDAIQIGRALQSEGFIESVDKGGPYMFKDARLFYGFTPDNRTPDWEEDLRRICETLSSKIKVSDQTYHLKVYEDSFTGREAVTKILQEHITSSRRDAVLLGRALMHDYQLFEHVTRYHAFEDEEFFYRFVKQSEESTKILEKFRKRRNRGAGEDDDDE